MLRARLSYQLFGLVVRTLPGGLAARVNGLLGLKVPTTPKMLAGTLMTMSGHFLMDIEKGLLKVNEGDPDFKGRLSPGLTWTIGMELLCALTWLGLHVLNQDDFGAEWDLFELYVVKTLEELKGLLKDKQHVALFEQIAQETRDLYLLDRPTLRELVDATGVNWYGELIDKAEREGNWMATYVFKAETRITGKLPIAPKSIYYLPSARHFGLTLLASMGAFKKLRPVFVAPGEARG